MGSAKRLLATSVAKPIIAKALFITVFALLTRLQPASCFVKAYGLRPSISALAQPVNGWSSPGSPSAPRRCNPPGCAPSPPTARPVRQVTLLPRRRDYPRRLPRPWNPCLRQGQLSRHVRRALPLRHWSWSPAAEGLVRPPV